MALFASSLFRVALTGAVSVGGGVTAIVVSKQTIGNGKPVTLMAGVDNESGKSDLSKDLSGITDLLNIKLDDLSSLTKNKSLFTSDNLSKLSTLTDDVDNTAEEGGDDGEDEGNDDDEVETDQDEDKDVKVEEKVLDETETSETTAVVDQPKEDGESEPSLPKVGEETKPTTEAQGETKDEADTSDTNKQETTTKVGEPQNKEGDLEEKPNTETEAQTDGAKEAPLTEPVIEDKNAPADSKETLGETQPVTGGESDDWTSETESISLEDAKDQIENLNNSDQGEGELTSVVDVVQTKETATDSTKTNTPVVGDKQEISATPETATTETILPVVTEPSQIGSDQPNAVTDSSLVIPPTNPLPNSSGGVTETTNNLGGGDGKSANPIIATGTIGDSTQLSATTVNIGTTTQVSGDSGVGSNGTNNNVSKSVGTEDDAVIEELGEVEASDDTATETPVEEVIQDENVTDLTESNSSTDNVQLLITKLSGTLVTEK